MQRMHVFGQCRCCVRAISCPHTSPITRMPTRIYPHFLDVCWYAEYACVWTMQVLCACQQLPPHEPHHPYDHTHMPTLPRCVLICRVCVCLGNAGTVCVLSAAPTRAPWPSHYGGDCVGRACAHRNGQATRKCILCCALHYVCVCMRACVCACVHACV